MGRPTDWFQRDAFMSFHIMFIILIVHHKSNHCRCSSVTSMVREAGSSCIFPRLFFLNVRTGSVSFHTNPTPSLFLSILSISTTSLVGFSAC